MREVDEGGILFRRIIQGNNVKKNILLSPALVHITVEMVAVVKRGFMSAKGMPRC